MNLIKIDTNKLKNDGERLLFLSNRYIQYINMLKLLINKIDSWNGADADQFKEAIANSYTAYEEMGSVMKEYAYFLIRHSKEIETLFEKYLIQ